MYRTSIYLSSLITNLKEYGMHKAVFHFIVWLYFEMHTPTKKLHKEIHIKKMKWNQQPHNL